MRVLIDINHPAQVHFFKNLINNLLKDGNKVKITARDKDVTHNLLHAYNLEFESTGKTYNGLCNKGLGMVKTDIKIFNIAKIFKPDIMVSASSPYAAQVSRFIRKPHIAFSDSEPIQLINLIVYPFSDVIITPTSYKRKHSKNKHIKYNGFKELAYLHPNYFKPDKSTLDKVGLDINDQFAILRFVAWKANHDIGHFGFTNERKIKLVRELEKKCHVFITSEGPLPSDLEKYRLNIKPHQIHDILYYAKILVGDGQTMTTEAAVLGTPAVQCNSLVGTMGNFQELESKYHLIYALSNPEHATAKALELLENEELKKEWYEKKNKLIKDKIDVTQFMTDFIQNYPDSHYKSNTDVNKNRVNILKV